jgi:hypothetical protein
MKPSERTSLLVIQVVKMDGKYVAGPMNSPLLGSFLPWVVLFVVLLGDRSGNVYSKALQADEGVHVRLELMWTVGCPELQAADGRRHRYWVCKARA